MDQDQPDHPRIPEEKKYNQEKGKELPRASQFFCSQTAYNGLLRSIVRFIAV